MIYNFFSAVIILILLNLFFLKYYKKVSKLINIYDNPDFKRKIHKIKTPILGGFVFFINILFIFVFSYFLDLKFENLFSNIREYFIVIIFYTFFFILGLADDVKNLKPFIKFLISIFLLFTFLILDNHIILKELNFYYFDTINLNIYLAIIFTIFCIFSFQNALNMYDGSNLQNINYLIIIFLFLLFKSNLNSYYLFLFFPTLVFYILNYKGKIFMGNNGTISLSFLISFLIIKNYNLELINYCEEILLLMLVPGLDMLRVFYTRISSKKNPFLPDNNHIHHLLLKKFKKNFIVQIFLFFIIMIGPLIFLFLNSYKFSIFVGVLAYISLVIFLKNNKLRY